MDEIKKTALLILVERARGVAARIEEEKRDRPRDQLLIRQLEGQLDALRDLQDVFLQHTAWPWHSCATMFHSVQISRAEENAKANPDPKKVMYWAGREEAVREFGTLWAKNKELHRGDQDEFLQLVADGAATVRHPRVRS